MTRRAVQKNRNRAPLPAPVSLLLQCAPTRTARSAPAGPEGASLPCWASSSSRGGTGRDPGFLAQGRAPGRAAARPGEQKNRTRSKVAVADLLLSSSGRRRAALSSWLSLNLPCRSYLGSFVLSLRKHISIKELPAAQKMKKAQIQKRFKTFVPLNSLLYHYIQNFCTNKFSQF